jgi:cytoskeleton protein RodZ
MTDTPEDQNDSRGDGLMAGERLAAARRAQNISVLEIAKELHLDEFKIRAIESNEFAVLGAPVFAKGHLRKYAELVNVPIEDVLTDYYKLNRAQPVPPIVGPRRKRERDIQLGPWIAGIAVLAVVAAAGYWWMDRSGQTGTPRAGAASGTRLQPTLAIPVDGVDRDANPESAGIAGTEQDRPSADAGDSTADAAPESVVEPVAVPDSGVPVSAATESGSGGDVAGLSLTLEFSGDCWTEVTDANGKRLFFDLGTTGRRVTVAGPAPLRVLLGSSDNVQLSVAGEPYTIPDSARRGETARLTINSQ